MSTKSPENRINGRWFCSLDAWVSDELPVMSLRDKSAVWCPGAVTTSTLQRVGLTSDEFTCLLLALCYSASYQDKELAEGESTVHVRLPVINDELSLVSAHGPGRWQCSDGTWHELRMIDCNCNFSCDWIARG